MYQPNVSRKTTSMIQVWGCLLLAIISVFLSFAPMVTLETGSSADMIEEAFDEMFDGQIEADIPDEVSISAGRVISSVSLIAQIVDVGIDSAKAAKAEASGDDFDQDKLDEKVEKLEERLESEETMETAVAIVAIVNTVVEGFKGEDEGSSVGIGNIVAALFVLLAILYVLVFTVIFPIVFIITALIMLITALVKVKDPLAAAPKISTKLPGLITMPMLFMVFQCIIPGMGFASGILWIWLLAFAAVLINVVVSRLRAYTKEDFIYATVIQGGALIGAIGYIVFFLNILKTNILSSFLHDSWCDYTALALTFNKAGEEISWAFVVDAALILVYVSLVISSLGYFSSCAKRLPLAVGGKKTADLGETKIARAVILLFTAIIPKVLLTLEHNFDNYLDDSDGAESFLSLSGEGESALNAALAGLIVMLVAEIAIAVCSKALCKGISKEEKLAVRMGEARTPEVAAPAEEVAAEEAAAEEAVAEEAVAEEAAAEEAVAEEAVAEEAAAEEAAAEEAAAEEAVAEEAAAEEAPAEEAAEEEAPAEEAAEEEAAPKAE